MLLIKNFRYRPEIDGLRALAVMAVVLFHCGLGVPGGYVGVDIFFVISGYLITSLILKDLQEDKFSMVHFWERRARRILPASIVMVLVTAVAGWFLLLPSDFVSFGKSATSQTVFTANFFFWRTTNYFAGPADEQPLLHTWSLAVEEQFYMVVPVFLLLLWRFRGTRSRTALFMILGGGFVVSLAFSVVLLPRMPAVTFYLLPTRSWELLCGSLAALMPATAFLQRKLLREALVMLGLAGMVLPCFLYTKDTSFPGLAALPPCLGAVLFILGCTPSSQSTLPRAAALFVKKPVVFVGLISYSLYLWHWPIVAFSHYWAFGELPLWHRWAILAAGFVLSIASWKWVETPFRRRRLGVTRPRMFAHAGLGLAAVAMMGLMLISEKGFPSRFSDRVRAFAQVRPGKHNRLCNPLTLEEAIAGRIPRLGTSESAPIGLLVWGDSHACSILPAALTAADANGVAVLGVWHSCTPPVIDYISQTSSAHFSLGSDSPAWCAAILEQIKKKKIPRVLLAARWSGYFEAEEQLRVSGEAFPVSLGSALVKTVRALREVGAEVWLLREVPNHGAPVPRALVKAEILGTNILPATCNRTRLDSINALFDLLRDELTQVGANILDVSNFMIDEETNYFRMEKNGDALYYDSHHLSQAGARLVADSFHPIFSNLEQVDPQSN